MTNLYEACNSRNYKIVFNERALPNLEGEVFHGTVQEFLDLCLDSVALISIRSGVLDLALGTGIRILALYPNDLTPYRAFTLNQWGQNRSTIIEKQEKDVWNTADALVEALLMFNLQK